MKFFALTFLIYSQSSRPHNKVQQISHCKGKTLSKDFHCEIEKIGCAAKEFHYESKKGGYAAKEFHCEVETLIVRKGKEFRREARKLTVQLRLREITAKERNFM